MEPIKVSIYKKNQSRQWCSFEGVDYPLELVVAIFEGLLHTDGETVSLQMLDDRFKEALVTLKLAQENTDGYLYQTKETKLFHKFLTDKNEDDPIVGYLVLHKEG